VKFKTSFAAGASPLCRFPFRLHRLLNLQSSTAKLIGWRGATQEFGVLLFALTVRALLTRVSNTPSADFCRALKPSHDAFSHERRASRSRNWAGQDSGPGSFPVATGREDSGSRLGCKIAPNAPGSKLRELRTPELPLLPLRRPQSAPQPLIKSPHDRGRLAEAKIASPSTQVRREYFRSLLHADSSCPAR
jgi:hypothetical protein